jgi:hypothetical protein
MRKVKYARNLAETQSIKMGAKQEKIWKNLEKLKKSRNRKTCVKNVSPSWETVLGKGLC